LDARDTLYGYARLHDLLSDRRLDSAGAAIETVLADVLAHQGEAAQADDITLVALRRVPA
jgi:serine phosphatase RsbU (regulator of sigma subunit)